MTKSDSIYKPGLPAVANPFPPLRQGVNIELSNAIVTEITTCGLYKIDALSTTERAWHRWLAFEFDDKTRDRVAEFIQYYTEHPEYARHYKCFAKGKRSWNFSRQLDHRDLEEVTYISSGIRWGNWPRVESNRAYAQVTDDRDGWVDSPEEILGRLENPHAPLDEKITAALFSETTRFSDAQKPRLLHALFGFAYHNRFAKINDDLLTAVGSAIRKFAMNMPESQFEEYALLFSPTDTDTLTCSIELELAKAITWRLSRMVGNNPGDFPALESSVSELTSDYTTPRLILQKNYASIVINSVIAVVLLNGNRQDELIDRIGRLRLNWFSELLARRLNDAARNRRQIAVGGDANVQRMRERLLNASA